MMSKDFDKTSISSILQYAKGLENNSLKDLCGEMIISSMKNKGNFGTLLEEFYFGYKPNSNSEPDFTQVELELKSTPLKKLKNGEWVCKERLVLNIINYLDVPNEDFFNSSFWKKNKNLLLVFYLHEVELLPLEYIVDLVDIWNFPTKDLGIIRDDWDKIKSKIIRGKAHQISEGDTIYLGACTKGSTAEKSFREQPFSDELAKQRAYSLKRSYLNTIYKTLKGNSDFQSVLTEEELKCGSFEDLIIKKFRPFLSLNDNEIQYNLGIDLNRKSKNYFSSISKRILGVSEDKFIEEFEKASITIKSIRIKENGKIKENISFPSFQFDSIIQEDWENSTIKDLVENKFLFVFYRENGKNFVFEKVGFWNLTSNDMDEFERVFERTKHILKTGEIVKEISDKGIIYNNFPKSTESYLAHVRPHGRDKNDTYPLPIHDLKTKRTEFTKQSFWINSSYVEKVFSSLG
jgi:DNA mismatch repair protein MutH